MATDYEVSRAFKRIENVLIDSMIRNLKRHRAEETKLGFNWDQWQAVHLRELERYRLINGIRYQKDFSDINTRVSNSLRSIYTETETKQEAKILDQIRKGNIKVSPKTKPGVAFFGVNEQRVNNMIEATKADFVKGEYAMLRQANDKYRQIIFDAQMYSASGATYEQAVDMATKDFLRSGIQSIVYKNGARHTMSDYAGMAIRTGNKRAYLLGLGNTLDKYGIHTVRVNKRTDACPLCIGYLGKVLVDDVYSGGTWKEAQELGVPTLSQAMEEGFLHPNCRDIYSLYIPGVSKPADPWSKEEVEKIAKDYNREQELRHAKNMLETYERMAKNSLDPENQKRYQARAEQWEIRKDILEENLSQYLITTGSNSQDPKALARTRLAVYTALRESSQKVRQELEKTTIIIAEEPASMYDEARGIMYIAEGAEPREVHHEIGHLVEAKLMDPAEVAVIKAERFKDTTIWDLSTQTRYQTSGGPVDILYVKHDSLISDYQGRVYALKADAFDADGYLKIEKLREFISEPYRLYNENPTELKAKDPELFRLIEEAVL